PRSRLRITARGCFAPDDGMLRGCTIRARFYTSAMADAADVRAALAEYADPADATHLQRFFKTGAGQYGEGDVFLGVRVPATRSICQECGDVPLTQIRPRLRSRVHEDRSVPLMLLVESFARADATRRRRIYEFYLGHTA